MALAWLRRAACAGPQALAIIEILGIFSSSSMAAALADRCVAACVCRRRPGAAIVTTSVITCRGGEKVASKKKCGVLLLPVKAITQRARNLWALVIIEAEIIINRRGAHASSALLHHFRAGALKVLTTRCPFLLLLYILKIKETVRLKALAVCLRSECICRAKIARAAVRHRESNVGDRGYK